MRILVKIGGAQLEHDAAREDLAAALDCARTAGHEIVLVHGGGNQIRTMSAKMGIEDRYHDGLRITDAATAEIVLMVLGGLVNRTLVATLQAAGLRAVGLTGADGATFSARELRRTAVNLGYVGEVDSVDPRLVETLLADGMVPVIGTVAPAHPARPQDPHFLNVNADHAAGPLAAALGCDALLFLTDVEGVLDDGGAKLESLTLADCDALVQSGTISGGMLPKIEAALGAARDAPAALVKIAPAAGTDAVVKALDPAVGTRMLVCEVPHG